MGGDKGKLTSAMMGLLGVVQDGLVGLIVFVVSGDGGCGGGAADDEIGAGLLGESGEEITGILDCRVGGIVDGEVVVGLGTGRLVSGEVVVAGTKVVSPSLLGGFSPPVLEPGFLVPCAVVPFALVAFESALP